MMEIFNVSGDNHFGTMSSGELSAQVQLDGRTRRSVLRVRTLLMPVTVKSGALIAPFIGRLP
jgi:hypothetical protein